VYDGGVAGRRWQQRTRGRDHERSIGKQGGRVAQLKEGAHPVLALDDALLDAGTWFEEV
jgi:hypothetical protein